MSSGTSKKQEEEHVVKKGDDHDGGDDDNMGEQQFSDPDRLTPRKKTAEDDHVPEEESALWHGYVLAKAGLPLPKCVCTSEDLSRPNYTKIKSAEFCDTPEALDAKADLLIEMIRRADHPLLYCGAGISTSSGISDYASNAKGSTVQPQKRRLTMDFINDLKPTPAHRVLSAMEKKGLVWAALQQNHDGLLQKAGFPGDKVNELHGCWLNQKDNPIIKMSGSLRSDLFEWCLKMEEMCDFVFAVGTSFSGLNSDRCAASCAERHMHKGKGQGLAIISIQRTPYDKVAALRVYSKIDAFMLIVAKKLGITVLDTRVYPYVAPRKPVGPMKEEDWQQEQRQKRQSVTAAKASSSPPTQQQQATATATGAGTKSSPPSKPTTTTTASSLGKKSPSQQPSSTSGGAKK